jgi:hypothetical protein
MDDADPQELADGTFAAPVRDCCAGGPIMYTMEEGVADAFFETRDGEELVP